jgi:hypothetical protein
VDSPASLHRRMLIPGMPMNEKDRTAAMSSTAASNALNRLRLPHKANAAAITPTRATIISAGTTWCTTTRASA